MQIFQDSQGIVRNRRSCLSVIIFALCIPLSTRAQWITQEVPLAAGWNAVYLEVQPEPADCDTLFAGHPIEKTWMWNRRFSTVEFNEDPDTLLPGNPHWLTWLPPDHAQAFLRNLHLLQGGQPYLIKVQDGQTPFVWTVKGKPVLCEIDWLPGTLNFVGFCVNPGSPPSFTDFFGHTDAIEVFAQRGGEVYRVQDDGSSDLIRRPSVDLVLPNMGYWIRSKEQTDYTGPVQVDLDYGRVMDFGADVNERRLHIRNVSHVNIDVYLDRFVSEIPPPGEPELAGDVPLSYFLIDLVTTNQFGWLDLPPQLSKTLAPGEMWNVRMAVRRNDMTPYSPVGTNGFAYQTLLQVTESLGMNRLFVPVSAER